MKQISRRGLLGLALAGLAGCKCLSTNKAMDLPLPMFHIVKLSRDRNYFRLTDDKNFFILHGNGRIIMHRPVNGKADERIFIPTYNGKHEYEFFVDSARKNFPNYHGRFYEIINMDTGKGSLLYA